jgi:gas vesicle protein
MSENRNIRGPIWGLLIGGAIGSVIALLYAPKPGKDLRSDISKKTNELVQDGKKKTNELWTNTKSKAGKMLEGANSMLSTGKEKLVTEAEKVKEAFKAGAEAYSEERSDTGLNRTSTTGTTTGTKSGSSSRS